MTKLHQAAPRPRLCDHSGLTPVAVGPYNVLAGGTMYDSFFEWFDYPGEVVLVPLTDRGVPEDLYEGHIVVPLHLKDFGGVPSNWRELLEEQIVPRLGDDLPLLAFCAGSHGRTGTFLASLIALLETPEETPDPIAAVRERHCHEAVETRAQAEAIFALRGQPVPQKYLTTIRR